VKIVYRALAVIVAMGLSFGGAAMAHGAAQPVPLVDFASDSQLSPVGERAIEDVRRCLSASDVLNVFYLIDNSGSLAGFQDGRPGTDEEYRRVDVINQSLRSLSELSTGSSSKTINFSMGFFSSSFSPAVGWTKLSKDGLAELEANIANQITVAQPPGGFTHWEAGVTDAHRALRAQQGAEPGCQMMVWLTDGGINVNNSVPATEQSGVDLCGTDFRGGDRASAVPNGTFNSLRQSGVAVFAVLLDIDSQTDDWQKDLMRPLAEGTGLSAGQAVTCGVNPIPADFSAGAFIEANSVTALSTQFLKLAARISGGSYGTMISKDKISVPKGVARLQVIGVDGQAILTSPSGRAITPSTETDGFIDAQVLDDSEFGTWSVTATDWSPPAIVWGALALTPERTPKVAGGAEQTVAFTLDSQATSTIGVEDYEFTLAVTMTYPDGSTDQQSLPSSQLSAGANSFSFVPNPAFSEVQIRYSTENLRTREGQVPLAALVAEQNVTITPPTHFPTVSNPVLTQALVGSISPAEGVFTLTAPLDGNSGTVCFPGLSGGGFSPNPQIVGDSADRLADWNWALAPSPGAQIDGDCVVLGPGEQATVSYTASHPTSADSVVQALTEITLGDGEGGLLTLTKEIVFPSERIYFSTVGTIVRVTLIALGVLLPFLVLYLVALLTTKVYHGRELRRAKFPVIYNNETKSLALASGGSLTAADLGKDEFAFRPPVDDFTKLEDPDLGTLGAVVSPNPLHAPWFEITPRAGNRIFSAKEAPPLFKGRFDAGKKALFAGDMSRLWALNFSEAQLRSATSANPEIRGDLVVFSRDSFGTPVNMPDTMTGVLNSLKASSAIKNANEALVAEATKGSGAAPATGSTPPPPPPPPGRGGSSFAPPSGSGGAPPPPPRPPSARR
jgi:hypothetical protein